MAEVDRNVFVIFGGTGDLARRKLIPALYDLITSQGIADRCIRVGVASRDLDDDDYRALTRAALKDMVSDGDGLRAWCDENVFYQRLGRGFGTFEALGARIELIHEQPFVLEAHDVVFSADFSWESVKWRCAMQNIESGEIENRRTAALANHRLGQIA